MLFDVYKHFDINKISCPTKLDRLRRNEVSRNRYIENNTVMVPLL